MLTGSGTPQCSGVFGRWARRLLAVGTLVLAGCSPQPVNSPYPDQNMAQNVLHTAFAQRSPKYLDPASSYSSDESPFTYSIYEPLYGYHYLKRPYKLVPRAAQEVAQPVYFDRNDQPLPDDAPGEDIAYSVYDIHIRPGILFQPHPAFARNPDGSYAYWPLPPGGLEDRYAITDFPLTGTRTLTAHDYVYGIRRLASPRVVSPAFGVLSSHIQGLRDYAERLRQVDAELKSAKSGLANADTGLSNAGTDPAASQGRPAWLDLRDYAFDGVQALDDHTLRIRVNGKYPQFRYWLAMTFTAPVPWEADRFYQQPGMAQRNLSLNTWPVGTGAYMMVESIQNRRHVMARNPNFRGEPYPCEGMPDDKARELLADCGKVTPFIDRIEFALEKESVPLMGKFLQGYYDIPEADGGDYGVAMRVAATDSAEKAELYADRGLQLLTSTAAQITYLGFNWLDPVVGYGDTPAQQEKNRKLRQAISIAFNWEQFVSIFLNDQAQVAQGPLPPGVAGYEPLPQGLNHQIYRWEGGRAVRRSLDEARRLLAEAGYPEGRHADTGEPLILHFDSAGGLGSSPTLDWMRRQLKALNVELEIRATDYNRFQDKMRQGVAQMFMWGWIADYPDAENFLFLLYGENAKAKSGGENASNYQNPRYDALFRKMRFLDEGPEKEQVVREMIDIVQHDMPWMFGFYPYSGGAYQAWVGNAQPTQMVRNTLQYLKIDPQQRAQSVARWNTPLWWPLWVLLGLVAVAIYPAWRVVQRRERKTALGDTP
ncbi:MAG: ABC transporter substrate-binding protein [Pusillimonas sp.]